MNKGKYKKAFWINGKKKGKNQTKINGERLFKINSDIIVVFWGWGGRNVVLFLF